MMRLSYRRVKKCIGVWDVRIWINLCVLHFKADLGHCFYALVERCDLSASCMPWAVISYV